MGRTKGDAARTKNRPSSSSLAASLVPTGAATIGFGGYVGSARVDPPLTTDESSSATTSSDVDTEMLQHIKRLSRKDPTTKLKALATLSQLFKQKQKDEIMLIIPQWAFEYKRLLQDYNREVRKAAQGTMNNLIITVGRALAPYLKSLFGPWWVSQFDPVSEVSQSARRSLQDAFPAQEKRLDALVLCTNEIFLYLEENLKLTPQSMSDKATPSDELEEMYFRVISTSLLAVATLVDILYGMQLQRLGFDNVTYEPKNASKARESVKSSVERIFFGHQHFVEFLKSQSPAVRSATYAVMGSFIKHMPHLFNEKNMKTVSLSVLGAFQEKDPTCHPSMWEMILLFSKNFSDVWGLNNIQKTVLNRFWHFLRNGCYGSQQVSYPVLIRFIEVIPPKAIEGEQFFLSFFQNLWQARNPSHSSTPERLAFFQAFKECFLWVMHNTSRFSGHQFRVCLLDNIFVNLLWCDYLLLVSLKNLGGVLPGSSSCTPVKETIQNQEKSIEKLTAKYPLDYRQELGKCIVEVLSDMSVKESDLLITFSEVFQENCMEIILQAEHIERASEHVDQIVNFLLLLEQLAVQKGAKWPIELLVIPMIRKSFPTIKSLDSPDAVKILSVTVSLFGPRQIVSPLFDCNKGDASSHLSDECATGSSSDRFLFVFKELLVPWCLGGSNHSSARLDLLLALLDDELFSDQWCGIMTYATKLEEHQNQDHGSSDFDRLSVLAMLMEKVREFVRREMQLGSKHQKGINLERWHHELLDSTAICVAGFSSPPSASHSHFLRAVLGGSTEDDSISFVSRDSMILTFKELLKKMIPLLNISSFTWVKDACYLIMSTGLKDTGSNLEYGKSLDLAKFAFEVIEGSIYCLRKLDDEPELVSCILAAIFVVDWEKRMRQQLPVDVSLNFSELQEDPFFQSIHGFWFKIGSQFWKSLGMYSRRRLETIIVQTVRFAIFEASTYSTDKASALCCQWVLEFLESFCCDHCEEQIFLDKLLDQGEFWPLWVELSLDGDSRSAILKLETRAMDQEICRHHNFVAFVAELTLKLGVSQVIAGCSSQNNPSTSLETQDLLAAPHSYSRAWLAAEILCAWKWEVGHVLDSFLPLLSEFTKEGANSSDYLLDSIVHILLDGALAHGTSNELCFPNVWLISDDEIEHIQEPFLRALVSLLSTLIVKDKVWGQNKCSVLFDHVVDMLFNGMMVNRNCLRILPYIINILVQSLRRRGTVTDDKDVPHFSFEENQVHAVIHDWLQRALLLPPIISWLPGQDVEEWIQVIISCYPLDAIGGNAALKTAFQIDTSKSERTLLVDLFRKQHTESNISTAVNQSQFAQNTLSKLTSVAVSYCWKEFNGDDWEFVLSLVRRWIEPAVMLIEEIAENVDEIIMKSSGNLEMDIQKLDQVVHIDDQYLMNVARNALFMFSLFIGLIESPNEEEPESLSLLRTEKWSSNKDQILEMVLRLFFATGVTEAIAGLSCPEASSIVASSRLVNPHFWELVGSIVVRSPHHVRNSAVQSMELWELNRGAIGSLYAILFSSICISSLQFAAYVTLSTEPISQSSITKESISGTLAEGTTVEQKFDQSRSLDANLEETVDLREEISCMIKTSPSEILEMDLVARDRVNVLLSWALLLSHLQSLPLTSTKKQRLIQCIQDSGNSKILDCLFQHIPLSGHNLKKKDIEIPSEVSQAAKAARHAISTGSLLLYVETLWPIGREEMASLAGSIYGLMLRVLPAYVRDWFTSLRDRSTSAAIEYFTKTWCSPPLLADELSQIKKDSVVDENFSISVSKSSCEVVATYKKEETGMDLVISLPPSYPLRPVDVDCTRSLGISDQKQRKWLMSMIAFVRSQNGALAEAIRRWKSNFDKEFEGVEECPICYSIIHTANNTLPRLACKTCKYKFHSACLYKWFSTSHKSTCPLCQSPF